MSIGECALCLKPVPYSGLCRSYLETVCDCGVWINRFVFLPPSPPACPLSRTRAGSVSGPRGSGDVLVFRFFVSLVNGRIVVAVVSLTR